jgi:hypothetical protein
METDSSLRNGVFLNKNMTMDNVQKNNVCINVPLSQTFRGLNGDLNFDEYIILPIL